MQKTTESSSEHTSLDTLSIAELSVIMNSMDQEVAVSVKAVLPSINALIEATVKRLNNGGRLFYLGAGTSGRLGVLDASECPPTFGVSHDLILGLIAGGDGAIRKAVEFAEDNFLGGAEDLQAHGVNSQDMVVGLAASGTTPYVIGALEWCRSQGIATGCITCNPGSPVLDQADYPVCVEVGPEFVRGSTRLKAGTAQKLVLNMLSTISMIRLGKVVGNKMVDMQLSNKKLIERGVKMILEESSITDPEQARTELLKLGSVRKVIEGFPKQ